MRDMSEILSRANLKSLSGYILYGIEKAKPDHRSYEERNEEIVRKFTEVIQNQQDADALETATGEMLSELSQLYMEIGLRAGIQIGQDISNDHWE